MGPTHLQVLEFPTRLSDHEHQEIPEHLVEDRGQRFISAETSCDGPHLPLPCPPGLPVSPFCPAAPEISHSRRVLVRFHL